MKTLQRYLKTNLPDLAQRNPSPNGLDLLPEKTPALLADAVIATVTEMVFKGDIDVPIEIHVKLNLTDTVTADTTQTPSSLSMS